MIAVFEIFEALSRIFISAFLDSSKPPLSMVTTFPPACLTKAWPAEISHGQRPYSKNASTRPHATDARSNAAPPIRRMSRTLGSMPVRFFA